MHGRIEKISQVSALLEDGQLFAANVVLEPGQVLIGQEEIVLIDDDADVGVGAQAGFIRPQITGFFQWSRPSGRCLAPVIGNDELLKVILVGILKNFLIQRRRSECPDAVVQDSLVVPPLAAENNIPQDEPKRQSDEKLGLDAAER